MGSAKRPADDLSNLSYEQARDELTAIVARLEGGQTDLEEAMRLWERGEQLAEHCTRWLDGAQARLSAQLPQDAAPSATPPPTSPEPPAAMRSVPDQPVAEERDG